MLRSLSDFEVNFLGEQNFQLRSSGYEGIDSLLMLSAFTLEIWIRPHESSAWTLIRVNRLVQYFVYITRHLIVRLMVLKLDTMLMT